MRPNIRPHAYFEIFVADGDLATHEALYRPLFFEGFRLVSFYDGDSFLNAMTVRRADCVLLDLDIADHQGVKIWDQVDARLSATPILATSQHSDVHSIVSSIRRGAFDFVTKPIKAEDVIKCLHQA